MRKVFAATVVAFLAVLGLALTSAPASAANGPGCAAPHTITTTLTDRPESPHWADDTFTRVVEICESAEAPGSYHAIVTDTGTFAAVEGATSPGDKDVTLPAGITGNFSGGFTADFTAAPDFDSFNADLDGATLNGLPDGKPSTGGWVKSMFSDFQGSSLNGDWSWTYTTDCETWVNANESVGDITKVCPVTQSPSPTPSASESPSPTPSASTTSPAPARACEAYDYYHNPNPSNLCADFPDADDPNCDDIGYRVTVLNPTVDPWKLDQGGVSGVGCQGKPLKFPNTDPGTGGGGTVSPTPSESSVVAAPPMNNSGSELPVTGSSKSTMLYLLGGGLMLVAIGGGAVLYARRNRDEVEFTS